MAAGWCPRRTAPHWWPCRPRRPSAPRCCAAPIAATPTPPTTPLSASRWAAPSWWSTATPTTARSPDPTISTGHVSAGRSVDERRAEPDEPAGYRSADPRLPGGAGLRHPSVHRRSHPRAGARRLCVRRRPRPRRSQRRRRRRPCGGRRTARRRRPRRHRPALPRHRPAVGGRRLARPAAPRGHVAGRRRLEGEQRRCGDRVRAAEAGAPPRRDATEPVARRRRSGHREGQPCRTARLDRARRRHRLFRLGSHPSRARSVMNSKSRGTPDRRRSSPKQGGNRAGKQGASGRSRGDASRRGGGPPTRGSSTGGGGRGGSGGQRSGSGRSGPPQGGGAKGLGGRQVEGRQAVRELLIADRRTTHEIWISAELEGDPGVADIVEIAAAKRVPLVHIAKSKLEREARSEAPQGVLAHAAELPEADLGQLIRGSGTTPPFLVAVDGVTDPGNLGAIVRCCDGAGATGLLLPRHRAVHVTPTVAKASAGAVEYVPMALVPGLPNTLERLRESGVWIVGLDDGADRELFDLGDLGAEPVCVVLGAEGAGLSRLVRERCDTIVGIPMAGGVSSLNVSAAAAVSLYEVSRSRRDMP